MQTMPKNELNKKIYKMIKIHKINKMIGMEINEQNGKTRRFIKCIARKKCMKCISN